MSVLPADSMEIEVLARKDGRFQVTMNGISQALAIEVIRTFCQAAGMPLWSAPPLIVEVLDPASNLQQCSYICLTPEARAR